VHAVEVILIRLSDPAEVAAKLPEIVIEAKQVLKRDDLRLKTLCNYAKEKALPEDAPGRIAELADNVYAESAVEHVRARSFRNILFAATFALTVFAIGFGILGSLAPNEISLAEAGEAAGAGILAGVVIIGSLLAGGVTSSGQVSQ